MATYSLIPDGDRLEQTNYRLFIEREFPSYETFWINNIVSLTNRPADILFKTDAELSVGGKTQEDICIAQLHYTVLNHLARVYEFRQIKPLNFNQFTESIVRLSSATDVADELLGRYTNKGIADPWNETAGRNARNKWRSAHKELQHIRDYRNKLVHGRIPPSIEVTTSSGTEYHVVKIIRVKNYIDWRKIFNVPESEWTKVAVDFDSTNNILDFVWNEVLIYVEEMWQKHLL